jgi:dTDP-4-dehydrorhamnose reductase
VDRILEQARSGKPLRVVADQVFSPTYAPDLAVAAVHLARVGARGLHHVANAGTCTWHDLAVAALRRSGLPNEVERIRAADLNLAARRPAYSVLDTARYHATGGPPMRGWPEALAASLAEGPAGGPVVS